MLLILAIAACQRNSDVRNNESSELETNSEVKETVEEAIGDDAVVTEGDYYMEENF